MNLPKAAIYALRLPKGYLCRATRATIEVYLFLAKMVSE